MWWYKPGKKRTFGPAAGRRGATVVEFAVVAPVFFLLLAGIIEFGQAFRIEHALSNASRRGARLAVLDGVQRSQVRNKVRAHCAMVLGVDESDVDVDITVNGSLSSYLLLADQGDEISVTVSIPYSEAGIGFFAHMFSSSTISSTCILEHE